MTRSLIVISGLLLLPIVLLANPHAVAQAEHKQTPCIPAKPHALPADFLYYHGLVSMHAPLPATAHEAALCPQTRRIRT